MAPTSGQAREVHRRPSDRDDGPLPSPRSCGAGAACLPSGLTPIPAAPHNHRRSAQAQLAPIDTSARAQASRKRRSTAAAWSLAPRARRHLARPCSDHPFSGQRRRSSR